MQTHTSSSSNTTDSPLVAIIPSQGGLGNPIEFGYKLQYHPSIPPRMSIRNLRK